MPPAKLSGSECNILQHRVSGRSRRRLSTKMRRSEKAIEKLAVIGLVVAMAIADFVSMSKVPKSSIFDARNVVLGLSMPSQSRRPSALRDWNQNFPPSANHAHTGMRRIPQTILSATASSSSEGISKDSTTTAPGSKLKGFLVRLLTGERASSARLQKPKWIEESSKLSVLPTWLFHLRPSVQLMVTIFLYLFHTTVLTQNSIVLPIQLFPNDRGNFQTIGLDTLAGMGTLALYQYLRSQPQSFFDLELKKSSTTQSTEPITNSTTVYSNITGIDFANAPANATITTTTRTKTTSIISASYFPDLFSAPHPNNMPWKSVWKSNYSRFSSILTLIALTRAYFFTGRFSLFWEDKLYEVAVHCSWMTVPMHRSLSVLLGHLSWIAMGATILRLIPRPQPFFQEPLSQWFTSKYRENSDTTETTPVAAATNSSVPFVEEKFTPKQLMDYSSQQSRHPQWVWWAVGGYFVSSWFFNIADFFNSYIFPVSVLEQAEENSIVSKLVNPEGSDLLASIVGYIAPCLTAPWWEEVLYRGFLLPALVLQLGNYSLAMFVSGVLFSVHHQSELAFLPLCVLGWTWATVYTKSKNLWTTILIHCMWNSRIFLGSWFGL